MEELFFKSADEKQSAIEAFDETTGDPVELDRIMAAKIGEAAPVVDESYHGAPQMEPEVKIPATSVDDAFTVTFSKKDFPDFQSADDAITKIKSTREMAEKQSRFIQEKLSNIGSGQVSPDIQQTIENLKKENETLKSRVRTGSDTDNSQKNKRASRLDQIVKARQDLEKQFDTDDSRLDPEYWKKRDELDSMQFDEIQYLNSMVSTLDNQIESRVTDILGRRDQETEKRAKTHQAYEESIKSVQNFCDKHNAFKLSKPFAQVDKEYDDWQQKVSQIYYGRPARDAIEMRKAMEQLERNSPDLVNKCQVAGIKISPDDDMRRYLAAVEIVDARLGYRKDPLTGDYRYDKEGNIVPLTRWDPIMQRDVPDTYPDMDAAYNDTQVKSGYYVKRILESFKEGGKSAIDAVQRRDRGAVELDNETGHGKIQITPEKAREEIEKIDEIIAVKMARAGDPSLLDRYNDLAKVIGWPMVSMQ